MTELEQLQNKLNRKSEETNWAVYDVIADCAKMLQNGCDKRAIRGYMEMAVHFYGKDKIAATIEDNGFTKLKEFI